MDYHHRDPTTKVRKVSSLSGRLRRDEIAKCDLICALCHSGLTSKQRILRRREYPKCKGSHDRYLRNHEHVREQKRQRAGCEQCGVTIDATDDTFNYFEFDHLDPNTKTNAVSRMCSQRVSIQTLQAEINKCQLLCRPCHRRRSASMATKDHQPVQSHEKRQEQEQSRPA